MRPRTLSEILADDSDDEADQEKKSQEELSSENLTDKNFPQWVEEKKIDAIISQFPEFLKQYPKGVSDVLVDLYNKHKNPQHWLDVFLKLQESSLFQKDINFSLIWLHVLKTTIISEAEQKKEDTIKYYGQIIQMMLTQYLEKEPQFLHQLTRNNNFLFCLPFAISTLESEMRQAVQAKLLQLAIEKYNPFVLERLTQDISLQNITSLEMKEKAVTLLEYKKEGWSFLHNYMQQFVNGFGKINYEGALLTCAQIAARKEYAFTPTVLMAPMLEEFFSSLKQVKPPFRERFMLVGIHINTCDMIVDEKNHASIFIVDSLGSDGNFFLKNIIFPLDTYFPNSSIYITHDERQASAMGCSVFALDDLRHLHTIERYLPTEYKTENGLFDYLKDNSFKDITFENKGHTIHAKECQIPLVLERTRQAENLLTEIIPSRVLENKIPINKRGETALESTFKFFHEAKNKKGESKKHNKRLEKQLDKMVTYNAHFIMSNSLEKIKGEMEKFTLAAFKKRIQQQNLLEDSPQPKLTR
jgi:hypothetical protein